MNLVNKKSPFFSIWHFYEIWYFYFPVFSDSWIIITIIVAGSMSSVDVLVTNQDMTSEKYSEVEPPA